MSKIKIILIALACFVVVATAVFVPLLTSKVTVTLDYCYTITNNTGRLFYPRLDFDDFDGISHNKVTRYSAYSPIRPTRYGYTFQGWYKDAGYTVAWINGDKIKSDITLYAKWVKD